MHDDQVGADLDRAPDQLGRRRHAGDDALDLERTLDLEAVRRVVPEPGRLERLVEVTDDFTEMNRHRGRYGKPPPMPPVKKPDTTPEFKTMSGIPLKPTYTPDDLASAKWSYAEKLGDPGQYPYTRGPHGTMYRGKPWTMRMFAGFGTPEDTNKRFKFLLESGQTGLSTAFDMPTLMGYDPDHARSLGEVGREGVSVAHLDDMTRLFGDIPLDQVSTSMTINAPAAVLLALYVAVAEGRASRPRSCAARSRTTCSRSSSRRRSGSARSAATCGSSATCSCGAPARCRSGTRSRSAAITSARPERPACRSSRSRSPTASATCSSASTRGLEVDEFAPAPVVLLGRPQRLLRGDREVPRRPPHVGQDHARALRREEPEVVAAAHARADRRRVADGAAAAQQRRAHDDAGARRGARRHAVAAHQQLRRDVRAADRGCRDARAAHAAGDLRGDRRRERRRSARAAATSSRR